MKVGSTKRNRRLGRKLPREDRQRNIGQSEERRRNRRRPHVAGRLEEQQRTDQILKIWTIPMSCFGTELQEEQLDDGLHRDIRIMTILWNTQDERRREERQRTDQILTTRMSQLVAGRQLEDVKIWTIPMSYIGAELQEEQLDDEQRRDIRTMTILWNTQDERRREGRLDEGQRRDIKTMTILLNILDERRREERPDDEQL
jgi:hypothetical protein